MTGIVERLDAALVGAPRLLFDDEAAFAIVSDFHMGVGDHADDFLHNAATALRALEYYFREGFTLILAGDMEELWENRDPRRIIATHFPFYRLFRDFHHRGRLFKLYGNHDELWRWPAMVRRYLWYTDVDHVGHPTPLLKGLSVYAGLLLVHRPSGHALFVTHGNQGDLFWVYPFSRFFLRFLWRPLQRYGLSDPTSPAQNHHRRVILEERLARWVRLRRQAMVSGHTHHPLFPPKGDIPYYNSGSGVHPYSVTAMEIRHGTLSLVKWSRDGAKHYGPIDREVMGGPRPFAEV